MSLRPETILKELASLWATLGKQDAGEESHGVLRACSMTLLVAMEGSADATDAGETIAMLMKEYPSRAIVLRVLRQQEPALEAQVRAQCWMPFGKRQQICCEQIEITASESRLEDAAAAIAGLTVADLPVAVWVKHASLLSLAPFESVLGLAGTIILDSTELRGLEPLLKRHNAGCRVRDLNWTRLTRLREALARAAEGAGWLEELADVGTCSISWAGPERPVQALYLGAWLGARLPRAELDFRRVSEEQPWGVRGVALDSGGRKVLEMDCRGHRLVFPDANDYALLREELSIPGRDPGFEEVLTRAARMNGGVQ